MFLTKNWEKFVKKLAWRAAAAVAERKWSNERSGTRKAIGAGSMEWTNKASKKTTFSFPLSTFNFQLSPPHLH